MLKMRLQRIGRRNDASFRVIVTDSRSGPKSGKNVALLGSYDPKLNRFQIDGEQAKEWIGKGVQVSDTVHNLLISHNVIEGKKKNVLPRKSPIIDEEKLKAEADAKAAAETEAAEDGEAEEKSEQEETSIETGAAEDEPAGASEEPKSEAQPTEETAPAEKAAEGEAAQGDEDAGEEVTTEEAHAEPETDEKKEGGSAGEEMDADAEDEAKKE